MGDMFDCVVDECCEQLRPADAHVRLLYVQLNGRQAFVDFVTAQFEQQGKAAIRDGMKAMLAPGGMRRALKWLSEQAPVQEPSAGTGADGGGAAAPAAVYGAEGASGGAAGDGADEEASGGWFESAGKLLAETLEWHQKHAAAAKVQAIARGRSTRRRVARAKKQGVLGLKLWA